MRNKLIFFLYRVLEAAAFLPLLLYALWRGLRDRRYLGTVLERFGFLPPQYKRTVADSIWLHAVSVGEVLSSVALIERLKHQLPGAPVFVSCSTVSGREAARSKLEPIVDGVFYAPFDYVFAVRRVIRTIRPATIIVLETEIWPNLYREAKRSGTALVVVNGRISRQTAASYARLRWFFKAVLEQPDLILTQTAADREHFIRAGAPESRVRIGGNLKYDFDPSAASMPEAIVAFLDRRAGPVWIAASTVAPEYAGDVDEDDVVIAAFQRLRVANPGLTLIVAPRKLERFDVVAGKLARADIRFARRSRLPAEDAPVLLLDSIGELSSLFPRADVVFMGGTLADRGGHNILEPALFAKPVVVGPHLENFAEIERCFSESDAFVRVRSADRLAPAIDRLLNDAELRRVIGDRAKKTAEAQRGAVSKAVSSIVELRWNAVPRVVPYIWQRPLAALWILGGEWKRSHAVERSLSTPVISIGGIAMGGAGKTPFVAHLAELLRARGLQCAVLTRGYKRRSRDPVIVLPAGSDVGAEVTGDEAQLLLRRGLALGIGTDRHIAGLEIEKQLQPDVFLLDDGFQHAGLRRDLDIVLLDGLDPFGGGEVFPAGRLREPIRALQRADAVVISRAAGRRFDGVIDHVRRVNPSVPVFTSVVKPVAWREMQTGSTFPPDAFAGRDVAAFCGLGNPATFWRTLDDLGCRIVDRFTFPDHHRYSLGELERIATKGELLVTTEKDAVNLPHNRIHNLYWLEIGIAVDGIDDLVDAVLKPKASQARDY